MPSSSGNTDVERIGRAGRAAYFSERYQSACEMFREARELAERTNDRKRQIENAFWLCAALDSAGRTREALARVAELLSMATAERQLDERSVAYVFNAFTTYIDCAQRLPVSPNATGQVYERARQYLRDVGHTEWRHKLLQLEADLYRFRCEFVKARAKAEEAWACRPIEEPWPWPSFTADAHFDALVGISFELRDIEGARRWIRTWEGFRENPMPSCRDRGVALARSRLARAEGRYSDALEHARRGSSAAFEAGRFAAAVEMVRAWICNGRVDLAREPLEEALTERHSESQFQLYDVWGLLGDFHRARARAEIGEDPSDEEFRDSPINELSSASRLILLRARRRYGRMASRGAQLDRVYETRGKSDEAHERIARCDRDLGRMGQ